ncbi:ABC transporter substrate-binding protein [Afifella sp. IM 167]|uniref:ABC transporter substrate-binding protein n=1 Tax=Afifella sp. IM 167 TaxID=2033586 RepID=UPI001CCDA8DA|nr:ABC transporter substrate-binding protein [Afifella sp. IM 167]MBZ8134460.1 peptide ABC transporter substrate-binding protein [Afifella sp. IM 167]
MVLKTFASAAISAALALGVAVGLAGTASAQHRGGTLTVGIDGPRHLNPAVQSGNATGTPGTQIFAGLIELDENFEAQPYLAESWEVSDDGKTYTFKLREDALFHDGEPVTSADVAYSLDVVKNNHPFGIAMFGAVEGVDTPDEHTAVIRLKYAQPSLMASLSPVLLPILPKHVYDDGQDIKSHPANSKPVGSGPFKFVEERTGEYITLERNESFFKKDQPNLDRIIFRIIPEKDQQARLLALQSGEVDYFPFSGMNARNVKRLQDDPNIEVTTKGFEAIGPTNYLEFNLRHKPFDDIRVRKAIAHAIDKDFITKSLHLGMSTRLDGPLHSSSPFYDADALVMYDVDLDKARELLDEAGLKPDANGTRFSMTLDYPTFHPESGKLVAEYLKPQLGKIGIDVTLRSSPDFATWANRVASWDYDATMNSIFDYPDPIIGVHRLFLCDNIKHVIWTNTAGYCNKRVDELLGEAASATDVETRKKAYSEFQKILSEDLPLIFTNEEPYTAVYNKRMKNPPLTVWGGMQAMDEVYVEDGQ